MTHVRILTHRNPTVFRCCTVEVHAKEGGYSGNGYVATLELDSANARDLGERLIKAADKAEEND